MSSFHYVFAAAEMLSKGEDISLFENKSAFLKNVDNLGEFFSILVDEETQKLFSLDSRLTIREGHVVWSETKPKDDFKPDLTLTIEKAKDIMKVLYELNFAGFAEFDESVFIPNFKEYIK